MSLPAENDLIVPFLERIADGNVHTKQAVADALAEHFNVRAADRGRQQGQFDILIDWCHADCTRGGFTENFGDGFRITARGSDELRSNRDQITVAYVRSFGKES